MFLNQKLIDRSTLRQGFQIPVEFHHLLKAMPGCIPLHGNTHNINVENDVFAENSWYFRNALVRANYSDLTRGITETTIYLERFFRSMLLGEQHDLRNRIMHVDWEKAEGRTAQSANTEVQSANTTSGLPLKCKNCTLEEAAVLQIVKNNPKATQKEIAAQIGKSERTVKTITVNLQEKGILQRINGKRNGSWGISSD